MTDVPDLDLSQVREDFRAIWIKNTVIAVRQISDPVEGGNYGDEDEPPVESTSQIIVNIQGVSSNSYQRLKPGIISAGSIFHAYVEWDTDLANDDRILWNGIIFIVKNWNDSMYAGQTAFREFDLQVIDFYET